MGTEPGIAITRREDDDGPLTGALKARGARVLHWGSIEFVPPADPGPLLEALNRLEDFDWISFSSPRAVAAVLERVPEPPEGLRVAVVGPSTADAVREGGWPVHRVPGEGSGAGLVEAFRKAGDGAGARVFFPASARARRVIPEGLEALGARVHEVTAYRLANLPVDGEACLAAMDAGEVRAVAFASPSALEGLRKGVGDGAFGRMARELPAAAMGATTAGALEGRGWKRIVIASHPTLDALAEAALKAAGQGPGEELGPGEEQGPDGRAGRRTDETEQKNTGNSEPKG